MYEVLVCQQNELRSEVESHKLFKVETYEKIENLQVANRRLLQRADDHRSKADQHLEDIQHTLNLVSGEKHRIAKARSAASLEKHECMNVTDSLRNELESLKRKYQQDVALLSSTIRGFRGQSADGKQAKKTVSRCVELMIVCLDLDEVAPTCSVG